MNPKADVLIVTVTDVEALAVMQVFKDTTGNDPKPVPIADRTYQDLGTVNGSVVFMALSGMGTGGLVGSQEAVRKGIEALGPDKVIMVGIAFGINEHKQAIGDILVSDQLMLYELQRVGKVNIPRGDRPHATPHLIDLFRSAALYWHGAEVRLGLILTGEKLVDNVDYRKQLKQFETEAIGGEMEGAGLYVACQDSHVEWILVKAICDWADGHKGADKAKRQQLAARNAASFVLHTLKHTEQNPNQEPVREFPPLQFPIFQVPYRNNLNFTGRESVIAELRRHFDTDVAVIHPQVVTGLGGVGKTQIANEYAYRYARDYDLIWWIRADDAATLSADYLAMATKLQLQVKTSAEQQVFVNIVRHWLESAPQRWLLVFDNLEQPEEASTFLPTRGNGHVLITSRNPDWRSIAKVQPIRMFTLEEAREFLLKRTGQQDEAAADRLTELLGGLPLALEQAAAFMGKLGMPFDTYTQLYEQQRQRLWQQLPPPQDYKATVTTTWELAFQDIRSHSPDSIALLDLCAFLAPDEIPLAIITGGQAALPDDLAPAVQDPLKFEQTLAALYQYSLVERTGKSISIHRLVQEVVRDRLGPDRVAGWIEIAVGVMNRVFAFDKYDMSTWLASAPMLPHALAVVTYAEQFPAALEHAAALWQKTGLYLRQLAEYDKARVSVEHALKIRRQLHGDSHALVAESLDYLGELYQEQGRTADAYPCHEQALAMRQRNLGQEHAETALSLNNLGSVAQAQGRYEQARQYYEAAFAIGKRVLGEQHPDTATSLNYLGSVAQDQGRYDQAREYYEAALAICKRALGEQHPGTAMCLNNLGTVAQTQGRYEQAREYYEAAFAIYRCALGEQHPGTAACLNNLGSVARAQGKYDQAREYVEEALAIQKRAAGEQHPNTARCLNNLGLVAQAQGKYDQAREYTEAALAIQKRVLGEQHPDTATSLNNLGNVAQAQDKYDQAREYYEAALAIQKRVLGEQHPDTAMCLNNLGAVAQTQGKYEQAREYCEGALAIYRRALGEQHPDTARALNNVGTLLVYQGKHTLARPYLEQALRILDQQQGDKPPFLIGVLSNLAQVMVQQRQFPQARRYMERALAICAQTTEEYDECHKIRQLRRTIPGPIGRNKKKKK